ncbi:MAG: hypothetical protein IJ800_02230 [Clostridia bacterium]|nr:hypothetical protein [Clostridia bacterium]
MSKSVYSVILNDDLVAELDKAAYNNGVSRSAMLDRILAEYLTVETPVTRMESIFSEMERLIGGWSGMKFVNQPSVSMASVQSALVYRYNPTVKYSVELFQSGDDLGVIKMSLRTQNPVLISLMESFYNFFIYLEAKYLGERSYSYEDGRFSRVLKRADGLSAEKSGEAIANFVRSVNFILNQYFSGLQEIDERKKEIENIYRKDIAPFINI